MTTHLARRNSMAYNKAGWFKQNIIQLISMIMAILALLGLPFKLGREVEKIYVKINEHDKLFEVNANDHTAIKTDVGCVKENVRCLREGYIMQHGKLNN
jgi:hypothetical protein